MIYLSILDTKVVKYTKPDSMNFKIILIKKSIVDSSKNWWLKNPNTIEYFFSLKRSILTEGKRFEDDMLVPEQLRRNASEIFDFIQHLNKGYSEDKRIKSVNVDLENNQLDENTSMVFDYFLEGLYLSAYIFSRHKTIDKPNIFNIKTKFKSSIFQYAVEGNYIARDLVNEPLSHLTAQGLSSVIKKLGKQAGFKVEVLNEKTIKSLKMGGVLSVNKGSVLPATFNILTYRPKNAKNKKPYVLVGKGVMYDTGGLSLKPTPNSMDMMKSDMAGAAVVIGSMYALAKAKSDKYIIGLIPAVENRPGGDAYVPGDVIKMMSGKTVEVLNTDAEGRLILADTLHYAKRYKHELVVDVATLTGSAARAVGKYGVVAMEKTTYHTSLNLRRLCEIGSLIGERVVPQPFWDDYKDELVSSVADITNLGGVEAGHITAGKFLEYFINYPWIHLDIAGSAFLKKPYLYYKVPGATGVTVRLLSHYFYHL